MLYCSWSAGECRRLVLSTAHLRSRVEGRPVRVLSASNDPDLNRARALLLRHHGFDVTISHSKESARQEIETSLFDVLIFGNTLPSDTCWELAAVFRSRNASGRIIEILPSPWANPKNRPDATVVSTDEPEKLIATIRKYAA
jgi:CheY-like chemotaxis protein